MGVALKILGPQHLVLVRLFQLHQQLPETRPREEARQLVDRSPTPSPLPSPSLPPIRSRLLQSRHLRRCYLIRLAFAGTRSLAGAEIQEAGMPKLERQGRQKQRSARMMMQKRGAIQSLRRGREGGEQRGREEVF